MLAMEGKSGLLCPFCKGEAVLRVYENRPRKDFPFSAHIKCHTSDHSVESYKTGTTMKEAIGAAKTAWRNAFGGEG